MVVVAQADQRRALRSDVARDARREQVPTDEGQVALLVKVSIGAVARLVAHDLRVGDGWRETGGQHTRDSTQRPHRAHDGSGDGMPQRRSTPVISGGVSTPNNPSTVGPTSQSAPPW